MKLFQDKAFFGRYLKTCFSGMILLMVLSPSSVLADYCKSAGKDLRVSFEVTQGRGGIWGYMEKSSALKKNSMIGFQVDSKLQRIIVIFEAQCPQNKGSIKEKFNKINNLLSDARLIFNLRPGKNPAKDIMAKINGLNSNLDKLIEELQA